jgi:hypothetical protein
MLECVEIISIALEKGIRIYTVKGNWQLCVINIQIKNILLGYSLLATGGKK